MALPNKKIESNGEDAAAEVYVSAADFCDVFISNMSRLYLIAYLMTGDSEMAERCFVAGIDTCVNGAYVCRGWAQSWARRAIIKTAIQMISPAPDDHHNNLWHSQSSACRSERGELLQSILDLCPFERCVYVMSVLERFSIQDCSLLLSATRAAVTNGRRSAIEHLAEFCASSCAVTADSSSEHRRTILSYRSKQV